MIEKRLYSDEIQIEIDDVYACPGHCPGCTLSSIERKTQTPDMHFSTLINSINKLIEYVPTLKHLEKINLTYGIADHFLMSNEYLKETFKLGAKLIKSANLSNPYNGVFYTASMIGKTSIIMDKVRYMHNISKDLNTPFYIIAVLDPKNLYRKNFSDVYKTNIIETNKLIGRVDLAINLSEEAVKMISPKELYEFALINHFDEVTINWVPTFDNLPFVYMDQKLLVNWLIEFDQLISDNKDMGTSYRPVIMRTINNIRCKDSEENYSFQENINNNLNELIQKSIQIDDKGNLFPKFEAIGDIAHTPRIGFKPLGNVNESFSIQEMFSNKTNLTKKNIIKQFTNNPCLNCQFNLYCANSGFHIYNYVLNEEAKKNSKIEKMLLDNIEKNDCPHIGKTIFKYYEEKCYSADSEKIS